MLTHTQRTPRYDPFRAPKAVAPAISPDTPTVDGPLRLTAYVDRYPPFPNALAGGEMMLHGLLKRLAGRGHRVRAITPLCTEALTLDGVDVLPVSALPEVLDDTQVLISHLLYTKHAIEAAWRGTIPLVYLFHNDFTVPHWRRWLRPHSVTAVVWNTHWIRESNVRQWPDWATVPSVIARPPVWPEDYAVDGPGFEREFVTIVNPNPAKGGHIFYKLAEARPQSAFLAVEGAYGQQLRPRAQHQNVTWQRQTPDMRGDVYARTRVLVVPSEYESFGRAAVEAAAAGAAVITADTPGLREAFGDTGLYATARLKHVSEWLGWLDMLEDPEVYANLQQAQHEQAMVLADAATVELDMLEHLLRRAAGAELPSGGMSPAHDPFRNRRHAHTVDVSEGRQEPSAPPEGLEGTEPAGGPEMVTEADVDGLRSWGAGLDAAAAELEQAGPTLHPGADGEPVESGEVTLGVQTAEGPMSLGDFMEHGAALGPDGIVHAGPGFVAEGLASGEIVRADEPGTPTPTEGAGTDDETGGGSTAPSGAGATSPEGGHPSSEPVPTTTGTTPGDAPADPGAAPPAKQKPLLADKVPPKATGDDGVVAWVQAGRNPAEVYDRAEAAEWAENLRESSGKRKRKAVMDLIGPILYED